MPQCQQEKLMDLSHSAAVARGCGGLTADGGRDAWITAFKASDGTDLSVSGAEYGSPQQAQKALLRNLKRVAVIIERGARLDGEGNKIGERAVVLLNKTGSQAAIFWTDEDLLQKIYWPTQRHVLALEKSLDN